jgi:hypothetical protein
MARVASELAKTNSVDNLTYVGETTRKTLNGLEIAYRGIGCMTACDRS